LSTEVGDLFVTLRGITDPFSDSFVQAADLSEESTSKIAAAAEQMATSLDASSKVAADAFKLILDAAVELAEGIAEPLAAVKTSIRSVATAARALGKAVAGASEAATPAFGAISGAAEEMAATLKASLATAQASLAGVDAELEAAAGTAATSATEIRASSVEGAAAATETGEAAAASAGESSAALGETAGALSKYMLGLAGTAVGVFEAVKGATAFNSEITTLNTQAGVSKSKLGSLGDGVLQLAGQVGFSPDSLAESLFHVESNFQSVGIKGPAALNMVKIAAEGAATGHADLVDVTNALTAAIASGIPGVQNYSQAMGSLNAIVGSGDMNMEQLAQAFGTGAVAAVKQYGLSITDVGAALAILGDNNIRGAAAGTQLRMSVQALANPVSTAGAELTKLGMTQNTLADDMQKGGLKLAVDDLAARLKKAGVTSVETGQALTNIVGKKAGIGLAVMVGQLDKFNSKYPDIIAGANNFGSAWQTTSHTIGQEFDDLKGGLEALGIKIGQMLLPALSKFLGWVRTGVAWIADHKQAVQVLAAVLGGMLVAAIYAVGVAMAAAMPEVSGVTLAIVGISAAAIYAWTHFKVFRTVVEDIGGVLRTVLVAALHLAQAAIGALISWFAAHKQDFLSAWSSLVHGVQALARWLDDNVIKWLQARLADLTSWWRQHSAEIHEIWSVLWAYIAIEATTIWDMVLRPLLTNLVSTWRLAWGVVRDTAKVAWTLVSGIVTLTMHQILGVIGIVLDLVTGHWSKAWSDLKKLTQQSLTDCIHLITSVAAGFGTLLLDAGKNVVRGLIKGIESEIGGAGSAMKSVASEIRSYLPFSPAKKGPLSGSGSPDLAGSKIGEMVASGITGSSRKVAQATRGMATAAGLKIGSSGNYSSLAVAGSGGSGSAAGGQLQPIIVQVDGRQLFKIMQTQALRNGKHNPTTGLVYAT
jgi:TP901 family phage tail tape measure protein